MGDPLEPPFGWDDAPEHPGLQCHDAHPERAHRIPASPPPDFEPASVRTRAPVLDELDGAGRTVRTYPGTPADPDLPATQVDVATALALLGSDPWSRFDMWSQRAWELAERSIAAATAEGERGEGHSLSSETIYDPRQQNLLDAARLCSDLAQAVCPLAAIAGLPGPQLELELPPMFGG